MQTITVTATSNANGRAQRVAKGMGRQRTVAVDFAKSEDWNKGNAAGELAKVLGWQPDHNITRPKFGNQFVNHDMS